MKNAYRKDIRRTITRGKKRFFAIMLITALGVCMMNGLRAACQDLRYTADKFCDEQNLYDIRILSTLGLTEEDVEVLGALDGVRQAEGAYSETVYIMNDGRKQTAEVKVLSENGINVPYVIEGALPAGQTEVAVTQKYISETGKSIGDLIHITEDIKEPEDEDEETEKADFLLETFRITGIVTDITDLNSEEGAVSFRDNSVTDYTFFVTPRAVKSDVFTSVYLTLEDTASYNGFSEAYETQVDEMIDVIEKECKERREQARYDSIYEDAVKEIDDAEDEANEKIADAEKELADKKSEAETEIADAKKEIADGWKELEDGEKELAEQEENANREFKEAFEQIAEGLHQLNTAISTMESYGMPVDGELLAQRRDLEYVQDDLREEEQRTAREIADAKAELEDARQKLLDGEKELEESKLEFQEKIADAEAELAEAQAEAADKIADAREKLDELEMTKWYVQDRSSLSGYSNVKSDADCIEAIGTAFPVIFLTVAILISLTTMTRMVEEDRGLIGTYKALGFSDSEIRRKYTIYAATACVFGGILGNFLGYVVLPEVIFVFFGVMYQIPKYVLTFEPGRAVLGTVLFVAAILIATTASCKAELRHMPASLMRPKAPKAGSRVLLEHITPLWKRMSFLNKVTARNLFRYKKRLIMTIIGITGCTALLVCGFTIKDTVEELAARQYEETYTYDALLVTEGEEELLECLDDQNIKSCLETRIESIQVINEEGKEETVQLIATEEPEKLKSYIRLKTMKDEEQELSDGDIFITYNASQVLGFESGDQVVLQNLELEQAEVTVTEILANYMGNNVYMTRVVYEELFGEYEVNSALLRLSDQCGDQIAFTEELAKEDGVLSVSSTQKMKEEFEPAFVLMNMVVYVVIVLAAALAVVVLFTLATTNISERERELATIKVLGFYDMEVHSYVNKETMILTAIGILFGLPAGKAFGSVLLSTLKLSSIYLAPITYPQTYVISAVMAMLFAIGVSFITNRLLNRINPVEALKSVE
ncbi:MAG: FtsX-like permease family protein [Lachnospiraceae bacterium]